MVVLHRAPGHWGGAPLRLPAHVFPGRPGADVASSALGVGNLPGLHGALRRDRRGGRALSSGDSSGAQRSRSGGRHRAALPRVDRGLVSGRPGGELAAHATPGGGGQCRHRSRPRRRQARRAAGRARAEPQGARGGRRLLLLLPHPDACPRHGAHRQRALRGDGERLDGSRMVDGIARRGPGRLGLVCPPARRRAGSDGLSPAPTRRLDRSVQRGDDRGRRRRGPAPLCGRGDHRAARVVDESARRHALSGAVAPHDPSREAGLADRAPRGRPGARRARALLGGRGAR